MKFKINILKPCMVKIKTRKNSSLAVIVTWLC